MIGMPADFALASAPLIASALGTETAMPSTFCDTAAEMSWASFWGSLFDGLQMSLVPSSLDACWAPFFTTDQNEPSSLCVTIANVRFEPCVRSTLSVPVDAELPVPVLEDFLLSSPPQPTAKTA